MYLPPNSTEARRQACDYINGLSMDKAWTLAAKPYKRKRSNLANSYYWAAVIRTIAEHTGHDGPELHEYLCGEAYGWIEKEYPTRTIQRPARTTSGMTAADFGNHIEWARSWAARELGLIIPEPNEIIT